MKKKKKKRNLIHLPNRCVYLAQLLLIGRAKKYKYFWPFCGWHVVELSLIKSTPAFESQKVITNEFINFNRKKKTKSKIKLLYNLHFSSSSLIQNVILSVPTDEKRKKNQTKLPKNHIKSIKPSWSDLFLAHWTEKEGW